jgi:hypothetical protein
MLSVEEILRFAQDDVAEPLGVYSRRLPPGPLQVLHVRPAERGRLKPRARSPELVRNRESRTLVQPKRAHEQPVARDFRSCSDV